MLESIINCDEYVEKRQKKKKAIASELRRDTISDRLNAIRTNSKGENLTQSRNR